MENGSIESFNSRGYYRHLFIDCVLGSGRGFISLTGVTLLSIIPG